MIRWIIQKTLAGKETLEQLIDAITKNEGAYELIEVIPFDTEIHYPQAKQHSDISVDIPIIYGSSTFMYGSLAHPYLKQGVFYDPETFLMTQYLCNWKGHMLNKDGEIFQIGELGELNVPDDLLYFIRPDSDSKAFSGMTAAFGEIKKMFQALDSNPFLNSETEILLASPKDIEKEWRCFIVEGKVISTSLYREHMEMRQSSVDIPESMIRFCEERCLEFTPHDVFVMDVALYRGTYKIIECNCFNGTGTYDHDLKEIVRAVHQYVRKNASKNKTFSWE